MKRGSKNPETEKFSPLEAFNADAARLIRGFDTNPRALRFVTAEQLVGRLRKLEDKVEAAQSASDGTYDPNDHRISEATYDQKHEPIDRTTLPVHPKQHHAKTIRPVTTGPLPGESQGELPPMGTVESIARPGERKLGQLVLPGIQADLQASISRHPSGRVE